MQVPAAAPPPVAAPPAAAPEEQPPEQPKHSKKKKKRKHADKEPAPVQGCGAEELAAPASGGGLDAALQRCAPLPCALRLPLGAHCFLPTHWGALTLWHSIFPSCRLEQLAAILQQAAEQQAPTTAEAHRQLAAVAASTADLGAALAALPGAPQPPAALQLLQAQVQQLRAASGDPLLPAAPSAVQLAGLGLQAAAAMTAAAAAARAQEAPGQPAGDGDKRQYVSMYMSTFADCYAAEVEALQDAEPPIPGGVLLSCVRMAADSDALLPPHLRQLVLKAAAANAPGS